MNRRRNKRKQNTENINKVYLSASGGRKKKRGQLLGSLLRSQGLSEKIRYAEKVKRMSDSSTESIPDIAEISAHETVKRIRKGTLVPSTWCSSTRISVNSLVQVSIPSTSITRIAHSECKSNRSKIKCSDTKSIMTKTQITQVRGSPLHLPVSFSHPARRDARVIQALNRFQQERIRKHQRCLERIRRDPNTSAAAVRCIRMHFHYIQHLHNFHLFYSKRSLVSLTRNIT